MSQAAAIPSGALFVARQVIKATVNGVPTEFDISNAADQVLQLQPYKGINREDFIYQLQIDFNIFVERSSVIAKDYQPWLEAKRTELEPFRFWNRYRTYLETEKHLPDVVIKELDRSTTEILDHTFDPKSDKAWDRRGLIVGHVQSGKTSSYTGLICKAIDAGFKLIIVLAGMHEDLRSQTQIRIDEGVLGIDTSRGTSFELGTTRVGVGAMAGTELYTVHTKTTSAAKGDFGKTQAQSQTALFGDEPHILVVKKNKSILKNVMDWVSFAAGKDDPLRPGKKIIRKVPVLVIDDEADHASVNTAQIRDDDGELDPELEPKTINKMIRQLLAMFEQKAYVGYTATPQANILIPPEFRSDDWEEDIFPESFIFNLSAPSNYYGSEIIFGSPLRGQDGLPIIRNIFDSGNIFPVGHRSTLEVEELPLSLKEAMKAFILIIAARKARGQVNVHNSMLVHVTRFKNVQQQVVDLVEDEKEYLRKLIEAGPKGGAGPLLDELRFIWENDFVKTTPAVQESVDFDTFSNLRWNDIEPHLADAVTVIKVKQLNSSAKDALDYKVHERTGLNVIAIGGDKLSRGMTLEDLSVSYFVRQSRMYDTLMQMGRWFGYRRGFGDLCRIYTDPILVQWYQHISDAFIRMREQFDVMRDEGATPKDFGLKILSHAGSLLVTSPNKMRAGTAIRLGYSGGVTVSTSYSLDKDAILQNFERLRTFVGKLGTPSSTGRGNHALWTGVRAEQVETFLRGLTVPNTVIQAHPNLLADFIERQQGHGGLEAWTVALASGKGEKILEVGNISIHRTKRSNSNWDKRLKNYAIKSPLSPTDEALDLDDATFAEADRRAREYAMAKNNGSDRNYKTYIGMQARQLRAPGNGLLIIYPIESEQINDVLPDNTALVGYAISFPGDDNAEDVEFIANEVLRKELFGE